MPVRLRDAYRAVAPAKIANVGQPRASAAVGGGLAAQGGNVRVIDLKGRMVIPGIVDSHNHIVLVGNRPGYHQPPEDAYSIQDVLDLYAARRPDVPAGQFITTIGDVSAMHIFPEHRLRHCPNSTPRSGR